MCQAGQELTPPLKRAAGQGQLHRVRFQPSFLLCFLWTPPHVGHTAAAAIAHGTPCGHTCRDGVCILARAGQLDQARVWFHTLMVYNCGLGGELGLIQGLGTIRLLGSQRVLCSTYASSTHTRTSYR